MLDIDLARREFMQRSVALGALAGGSIGSARAEGADLHLPSTPKLRPLTKAFPQKGEMILQRTRPPLPETPFSVFDEGVFTPNDRFFVRWHLAGIPESVDVDPRL